MAALIMAFTVPHVGARDSCSPACQERVKAKAFAKKYGGCRDARCVKRVRAKRAAREAKMSPRTIGRRMARKRGAPWSCVDRLISKESGWKVRVYNRAGSGAYGLPQALPGHKMASEGRNWRTSARTQLRWFFKYVRARYGGVCNALAFHRSRNWY